MPGADTPDEAVFLPGRNVLLLSKAMSGATCTASWVAMGLLKCNPFPDATPDFFAAYEAASTGRSADTCGSCGLTLGLQQETGTARGRDLPLELTFSCIRPVAGRHCGRCNKCAERRRAFAEAGLTDRTVYDTERPCIA